MWQGFKYLLHDQFTVKTRDFFSPSLPLLFLWVVSSHSDFIVLLLLLEYNSTFFEISVCLLSINLIMVDQ